MKRTNWMVMMLALVTPALAAAQEAASSQEKQATEIGVYAYYAGGARRFVGAGGRIIAEGRNFEEFAAKLGATPAETPGRKGNEDQWNVAVLNILSRQGWELIGCQWYERVDNYSYTCHFKRERGES
ncbi:MAG TPA: hypothetical protein VGD27_07480 [Longimicrobiales bacterium]